MKDNVHSMHLKKKSIIGQIKEKSFAWESAQTCRDEMHVARKILIYHDNNKPVRHTKTRK